MYASTATPDAPFALPPQPTPGPLAGLAYVVIEAGAPLQIPPRSISTEMHGVVVIEAGAVWHGEAAVRRDLVVRGDGGSTLRLRLYADEESALELPGEAEVAALADASDHGLAECEERALALMGAMQERIDELERQLAEAGEALVDARAQADGLEQTLGIVLAGPRLVTVRPGVARLVDAG
jgi:hypothetical protein